MLVTKVLVSSERIGDITCIYLNIGPEAQPVKSCEPVLYVLYVADFIKSLHLML